MDGAIELDFAGGRFLFCLPVHAWIAVERGPTNPARRTREYPVSVFTIYDELSAGIGADPTTGEVSVLPGATVFWGDIQNILEQALAAGNAGEKDGDRFEVGVQLAARLVGEAMQPGKIASCVGTAWAVLHAAIKGIDLKKKPDDLTEENHSPSGVDR